MKIVMPSMGCEWDQSTNYKDMTIFNNDLCDTARFVDELEFILFIHISNIEPKVSNKNTKKNNM